MKKIIFIILLTIFSINIVSAFEIDIEKIEIGNKANELIETLDKSYNISLYGFNKKVINDSEASKFAKEVLNISFSKDSIQEKKKDLLYYMHFSDDNGFDTLNASIFIEMFLKKIETEKINIKSIKTIRTIPFNENDILTFVYLPDAIVNNEQKDIVVSFWLKESSAGFRLFYPWLTIDEDLEEHFESVSKSEDEGNIIGGTYNSVSINNSSNKVSESDLKNIFDNNKNSSVQITGMNDSGNSSYGSGFYIREGVVVTTWSLFLDSLTNSNYVYVNDSDGNTYNIVGVVAADVDYDLVVLKLNRETGKRVTFGASHDVKSGDNIFTINSKNNSSFSINHGTNISLENGRLRNMFALHNSDVGSALYNIKGEVIGFNVGDLLNSELSYANSTDYLIDLQNILVNTKFNNIKYTIIESFKQKYYLDYGSEIVYNNLSNEVWNKYKKIGNLEKNITLPLVKADYVDKIVSLRYKNNVVNMIDGLYLVSSFTNELLNTGYKLTYQDSYKTIYSNNKYKVVIKNNLDYLVILIMEI